MQSRSSTPHQISLVNLMKYVENDNFQYLLCLDTNFIHTYDQTYKKCKAIEIAIVLVHLSTGKVLNEFRTFVMCGTNRGAAIIPCENMMYKTKTKTGFLDQISAWMWNLVTFYGLELPKTAPYSTGNAAFCTWNDRNVQNLNMLCEKVKDGRPYFWDQCIDIRKTFSNCYGTEMRFKRAARHLQLNLTYGSRERSIIYCARNLATMVACMKDDGCVFKLTRDNSVTMRSLTYYFQYSLQYEQFCEHIYAVV